MPSGIKPNRMKTVLDSGGVALGFGVLTFNAGVIEAAAAAGVDFVWLDLEHGGISPYDSVSMENLVRCAENAGLTALVRVPENNPTMIARILDTGVQSGPGAWNRDSRGSHQGGGRGPGTTRKVSCPSGEPPSLGLPGGLLLTGNSATPLTNG